jgi:hypothetical protein
MSKKEPPEGQLFSRLYIERPAPVPDSSRFRIRLFGYFSKNLSEHRFSLASTIRTELGVPAGSLDDIFQNLETKDLLSTITLVFQILRNAGDYEARRWIDFVQRVFHEESLGYRIDSQGGVHYLVDEEFERNRVSAIGSLTASKYAAVATSLESAFSKLDTDPMDTKTAIRDTFEALETLAKLLTNSNKNLDEKMVKKELRDLLRKVPEYTEPSGGSTISKFIESLADWVNAAHPYRHGQKTEKLVTPSMASAILFLSTGAAYIRWLVDQLSTLKQ